MGRPPEHPGSPSDPLGGNSDPGGHPSPGQQFNIGAAISWAWHKFNKNTTALVVPTLVYLVAFGLIGALLLSRLSPQAAGFGRLPLTGIGVFFLVIVPAGVVMQAAFLSGCLDIADGKPVTIRSFFHPHHFGRVAPSALLVIVLASIGNIICGFPGLIFSFFALFTIAFATDRALPPIEALEASIATVKSNTRGALLSWLVQILVLTVGALLCGVGMLVAFPVATLVQTYTCRRLSGGPIAPLTE
ncbi:MAG: hypothetical protein J2P17_06465 [Mycobacterium sp.]|nr:hypothetical protein [Mycobacterium sp.]